MKHVYGQQMISYHFPSESLATVSIPPESGLRRKMPRPENLRQPGYEDEFDFYTINFDCFWSDESTISLIGPPRLGFKNLTQENTFSFYDATDRPIKVSRDNMHLRPGKRQHEWTINGVPSEVQKMGFAYGKIGNFKRNISPAGSQLFAGKRALMTIFKYDPLPWIKEWASFYVGYHATNAILLYNNGATDFTSKELIEALSDIKGLELVVVVDWPFPYGPQAGFSNQWDSTYCQTGAMQHAFKRFLRQSKSVINQDIDELSVHTSHQSLHELVEAAPGNYLMFNGIWATHEGADTDLPVLQNRLHRDYIFNELDKDKRQYCGEKWAVVPKACPPEAQWRAHRIACMDEPENSIAGLQYRHFRNLTMRWKPNGEERACTEFPNYHKDTALEEAFKRLGWRD